LCEDASPRVSGSFWGVQPENGLLGSERGHKFSFWFKPLPQFAKLRARGAKQKLRLRAPPEQAGNTANTSHAGNGYFTVGREQKEEEIKEVLEEGNGDTEQREIRRETKNILPSSFLQSFVLWAGH
jgi:hypothetical protein